MGGGYPQLGSQGVKLDKDKLQLARLTGWRVATYGLQLTA